MCGISGVVSKSSINTDSFHQMNQIIKHRGPDDEGFVLFNENDYKVLGSIETAKESWDSIGSYLPKEKIENIVFDSQIALGHRRLSILDLSPKGHQPMCCDQERYWIIFNGEVYNFIEIRKELIQLGYLFATDTDTEVILKSYIHWGKDFLNKLNGMWSIVIYDCIDQNLFLSRDRFGIKPLYYWFCPKGDFYFASEIKQFTVLPGWRAVLNKERAFDYLYYTLTDHTDETLFKGVHILPPGCYFETNINNLKSDKGRIGFSKWYNPNIIESKINFKQAKSEFLDKFKDAIKFHLRADVLVGSALSGGLDSSSIVSYINILLKQEGKSELQKTFSSCSYDERFDERKWMEEVVKETKVEGHYIYPKGEDIFSLTSKIIWHMDEPYQSQSAFLGYHVFQEAKKNNVIVLLNGQGADEYLSGYSSYRILRQKKLLKSLKIFELKKELGSYSGILVVLLALIQDVLPTSLRNNLSFYNSKNKLLDKIIQIDKLVKKKKHPYATMSYDNSNHLTISRHQLIKEPLQKYLRWEDRNSMAHSVEARVPFLDHRIVEFVHSLPLEYLDSPDLSKRILVESMKGILPEKIRNRKDKKGFITPEEQWFTVDFKEEFLNFFDDNVEFSKGIINKKEARSYLLEMQNGKVDFDFSYWRIILFCIWMKTYNLELN
jgi:asparagine synthase (glutamine-hydrolysing)